ncbi:hypothetical protein [Actinomycetospora flava]|uniref:hypothetical protein n=1 Tax=Actinomycetospora flava TaxID=3129232 RepID=UPI0035A07377
MLVDKQGMTGRKIEYHTVPYRSISSPAAGCPGLRFDREHGRQSAGDEVGSIADCFERSNSTDTASGSPSSYWLRLRTWGRWDRALRRKGFDSTPVRGVDARRV